MAFPNRTIEGGDILLSVNGVEIGCATTHSIEINVETRDTTCKGTGAWGSMDYSSFSWSGSADVLFNLDESGLYSRYRDIYKLMISKQIVTISSKVELGSDVFEQVGQAIITGLPLSAPNQETATFSVSFEGVGSLEIVGEEAFYLNVTADGADFILVEELNRLVPHSGTGVYKLPVTASTSGYTVTAFNNGGSLTGSTSTGAVSGNTDVTVILS